MYKYMACCRAMRHGEASDTQRYATRQSSTFIFLRARQIAASRLAPDSSGGAGVLGSPGLAAVTPGERRTSIGCLSKAGSRLMCCEGPASADGLHTYAMMDRESWNGGRGAERLVVRDRRQPTGGRRRLMPGAVHHLILPRLKEAVAVPVADGRWLRGVV